MLNYQDYYNDVVKLREKILADMNMKRNIEHIKHRKFDLIKEVNKNPDDKSKSTKFNQIETVSFKNQTNKLPNLSNNNNSTFVLNTSRYLKDNYTSYLDNHSLINKKIHNAEIFVRKRENSKFKNRLNRVTSPLRKGILEESYQKTRKYSEFARRIKALNETEQTEKKKIDKMRSILPALVVNKIDNVKKILNL